MEKYIQIIANAYFWAFIIGFILIWISSYSDSFKKKEVLHWESMKVQATQGKYKTNTNVLPLLFLFILSILLR